MKIFLCLRNTQDWDSVDVRTLRDKSNRFHDQLTLLSNIDNWEKFVSIKYNKYRSILKKIAMSKWTLPWVSYDSNFLEKLDEEDILVPIDDDDWMHPDFEDFIIKNSKGSEFGFWDKVVNQTASNFNIHTWNDFHKYIGSNNYFFKVSFLKSQGIEKTKSLIKNHHTTLYVAKSMNLKIMDKKNIIMSLYNVHPGSFSVLNHTGFNNFFSLFPKNIPPKVPVWYEWAKEGIEEIRELILSLKIENYITKKIKFF